MKWQSFLRPGIISPIAAGVLRVAEPIKVPEASSAPAMDQSRPGLIPQFPFITASASQNIITLTTKASGIAVNYSFSGDFYISLIAPTGDTNCVGFVSPLCYFQTRNTLTGGGSAASRWSAPSPRKGRDGRSAPCSSSAMSSGRLFLDRVGRHRRPSPLHRHTQTNMRFSRPPAKGDISTLPAWGHFYFALTLLRERLTMSTEFRTIATHGCNISPLTPGISG
jgi:hypothetical protein